MLRPEEKSTCEHLINFLQCDFKLPGHKPFQPLISSLALQLKILAFTVTGCFGNFHFPRNSVEARVQHLSDRSSSSLVFGGIYLCLLTDRGPHFIREGSWAEALCPLYVVMPHTTSCALAVAHRAQKFLGLPGTGWHAGGSDESCSVPFNW